MIVTIRKHFLLPSFLLSFLPSFLPSFIHSLITIIFPLCVDIILVTFCVQVLLKDYHLAFGVLALVLVDLIILLVYTIFEGIQGNLAVIRVPNREYPMDMEGVG